MLDPRQVADRFDEVRAALSRRSPAWAQELEPVAELVRKRREAIVESEKKAAQRNQASAEMAKADKTSPEFQKRREELKTLSEEVKALEKVVAEVDAAIEQR